MSQIIEDLKDDEYKAKTDEQNQQKEYEKLIRDAERTRKQDSSALDNLNSILADLKQDGQDLMDDLKGLQIDLKVSAKKLENLHGECDWLLKFYTQRANARKLEIENLKS